mmetsp:Transcript_10981/g.24355  ORF Transcript_10981/g.24355 Transcript_10981/m.24355 type:complete len:268 (-) Transcript_10981:820-1623(-)
MISMKSVNWDIVRPFEVPPTSLTAASKSALVISPSSSISCMPSQSSRSASNTTPPSLFKALKMSSTSPSSSPSSLSSSSSKASSKSSSISSPTRSVTTLSWSSWDMLSNLSTISTSSTGIAPNSSNCSFRLYTKETLGLGCTLAIPQVMVRPGAKSWASSCAWKDSLRSGGTSNCLGRSRLLTSPVTFRGPKEVTVTNTPSGTTRCTTPSTVLPATTPSSWRRSLRDLRLSLPSTLVSCFLSITLAFSIPASVVTVKRPDCLKTSFT